MQIDRTVNWIVKIQTSSDTKAEAFGFKNTMLGEMISLCRVSGHLGEI